MGLFIRTYAALSELFGIYGRGEVEAPGVARARVLPVHEALAGLADPRAGLHQPHVQNLVNLRIGFVHTDVLSISRYSSAPLVLQKVASELHPKVRNHGEGPY